ncbi:hypothetical protein CFC21_103530 [Triticum aestivum]|uniref:Uncharacterized protein n=2 Tax=Triticum aestivum TaxID=4565 RepID=A0A9R1N6E8_WHEAT|nr:hypothetical protein CFC21_103530 [Triticum aestivum]
MCLRPKLLPLDRGYMHPRLEAAVLGDMHVQGEEVDEARRSNLCLLIAVSCFSICHLSYGRIISHAADLNLPYSSSPRLVERFSGCLPDDGEGRIRSDGYSAKKLETLAIDLLYKHLWQGTWSLLQGRRDGSRERRDQLASFIGETIVFFCQLPSPYCPCVRCMQTCGSWSL